MRFNINGRPLPVICGCIILLLPQGSCSLFGKESFHPSYESDWPDVSAIVHRYEGVFDAPYRERGAAMALGPILGNGDMGVYLSGTEDRLDYCMATSSFWGGCLKNIGFGGISISNAEKGAAAIPYHAVQDIGDAEIRASLKFGGTPVRTRAYLAPNENTLVTEIWANDPTRPVTIKVEAWARLNTDPVYAPCYSTTAGADKKAAWATRKADPSKGPEKNIFAIDNNPPWCCYAAIVVDVLGGTGKTTNSDGKDRSTLTVTIPPGKKVLVVAHVDAGKDKADCLEAAKTRIGQMTPEIVSGLDAERAAWWKKFWLQSYVDFPPSDDDMEEYYYGSLYQIGSGFRVGKIPPGLFGLWPVSDNTQWKTYTLDYNFFKNFYATAGANRLEQDNMYQTIMNLIPDSRENAARLKKLRDQHRNLDFNFPQGMPGIWMPHGATPWGDAMVHTAFGMKSDAPLALPMFVRHYEYTLDRDFLEHFLYPFLKEIACFASAYFVKDDSGRYMILDSHTREYGRQPAEDNGTLDLGLYRDALIKAVHYSTLLGVDEKDRAVWKNILENLSDFPTITYNGVTVIREGESQVNKEGESAEFFNQEVLFFGRPGGNPVVLMSAYPGSLYDLDSDPTELRLLYDTNEQLFSWYQQNSYGNYNTFNALLGWFPEENYRRLRKQTAMIRQANLTYKPGGHGIEATAAVDTLNTMMLRSNRGFLEFFSCWPANKDMRFKRLRTPGAFLVNARIAGNVVQETSIYSEQGVPCTVLNPWLGKTLLVNGGKISTTRVGERHTFQTTAGETYVLTPSGGLPPSYVIKLPINLAAGKPAVQSSTLTEKDQTFSAASAVDGRIDGFPEGNSLAITQKEPKPWWRVDLGAVQQIGQIRIYNREDLTNKGLYFAMLKNFDISILDENQKPVWTNHQDYIPMDNTTVNAGGVSGRYVVIQLQDTNHLCLSEVFVHPYDGTPLPPPPVNIAKGKNVTMSSTEGNAIGSRAVDGNTDGSLANGSVAVTKKEKNPWIMVDLGANHAIDRVEIYNTSDENEKWNMKNYLVEILDADGQVVWKRQRRSFPNPHFCFLAEGAKGRRIRISLPYESTLPLAEIEVYSK